MHALSIMRQAFGATVTTCPERGVELAEIRPGSPPDRTIQLTSVLTAGDPALIALARSLLEGEGIEYLVRGEGVQDLCGCGRIGAGYPLARLEDGSTSEDA